MLSGSPAAARPVVVELFTSEACSSCPPAEKLVAALQAANPDLLLLSFHVTYWNSPAWADQYGLTGATERQSWYAGLAQSQNVYTPEAVVDGISQMIGSDEGKVTTAIANAGADQHPAVTATISGGSMLTVTIGAGAGGPANIWLFGYDSSHTSRIGGGENGGATIIETNVVRSITPLGGWTGVGMTYDIPRPAGGHMAVLLQTGQGTILAAAAR